MRTTSRLAIFLLVVLVAFPMLARPTGDMPEFTRADAESWINSDPLSIHDLRGKVLLIDFWAFECWNCYRSFPWLTGLEQKFDPSAFAIIGIHTPEFEREKHRERVIAKARQFKRQHPIMLDNDYRYWTAAGNRYWPAYYLVDKQGKLREVYVGETHADTAQARKIEKAISALMAE